jgi:hypothetical protein
MVVFLESIIKMKKDFKVESLKTSENSVWVTNASALLTCFLVIRFSFHITPSNPSI